MRNTRIPERSDGTVDRDLLNHLVKGAPTVAEDKARHPFITDAVDNPDSPACEEFILVFPTGWTEPAAIGCRRPHAHTGCHQAEGYGYEVMWSSYAS